MSDTDTSETSDKPKIGYRFPKIVKHICHEDAYSKAVLDVLADFCDNGSGKTFIGYASLVCLTGASERTIQRTLEKLRKRGILTITYRKHKTNIFTLQYGRLVQLANEGKAIRKQFILEWNKEHEVEEAARKERLAGCPTGAIGVSHRRDRGVPQARYGCPTGTLSSQIISSDYLTQTVLRSSNQPSEASQPVGQSVGRSPFSGKPKPSGAPEDERGKDSEMPETIQPARDEGQSVHVPPPILAFPPSIGRLATGSDFDAIVGDIFSEPKPKTNSIEWLDSLQPERDDYDNED